MKNCDTHDISSKFGTMQQLNRNRLDYIEIAFHDILSPNHNNNFHHFDPHNHNQMFSITIKTSELICDLSNF